MSRRDHIVVVGASLAGTTVVDTLRRQGYDGALTLVGAEPCTAYNRPALSKDVLAGRAGPAEIALPPVADDVDQMLGVRATGLDPVRREVVLADGDRVPYDGLALTTGARARTLADLGAAGPGVVETTFRDLSDARRMARALDDRPHVVIVGAGILGMELASSCIDRGSTVTVVDRQPPLRAQLGPFLSDLLTRAAEQRGVRFAHHPDGVRLRSSSSGPPLVELADGRRFEGDHVLSAVGCVAEVDWLGTTGLATSGAVVVDSRCRVRPDIVAAGDVVAFPSPSGPRRTPWWTNAIEQGRTAAHALLTGDAAPPLTPSPYFWTEQFGMTVRVCGPLPAPGPPTEVDGTVRPDAPQDSEAILRWQVDGTATAAAVNKRISIGRLRAMTQPAVPTAT